MKSASPPSHGLSEGKEYTLKFGTNFEKGSRAQESYHVLRCKLYFSSCAFVFLTYFLMVSLIFHISAWNFSNNILIVFSLNLVSVSSLKSVVRIISIACIHSLWVWNKAERQIIYSRLMFFFIPKLFIMLYCW